MALTDFPQCSHFQHMVSPRRCMERTGEFTPVRSLSPSAIKAGKLQFTWTRSEESNLYDDNRSGALPRAFSSSFAHSLYWATRPICARLAVRSRVHHAVHHHLDTTERPFKYTWGDRQTRTWPIGIQDDTPALKTFPGRLHRPGVTFLYKSPVMDIVRHARLRPRLQGRRPNLQNRACFLPSRRSAFFRA